MGLRGDQYLTGEGKLVPNRGGKLLGKDQISFLEKTKWRWALEYRCEIVGPRLGLGRGQEPRYGEIK